MRTRSSDARERRRAIAALAGVAGRLAEDYLLMLPEALPFLAELLEDPDPPAQASPALLLFVSRQHSDLGCAASVAFGSLCGADTKARDVCVGGRAGFGPAAAGVVWRVPAGSDYAQVPARPSV